MQQPRQRRHARSIALACGQPKHTIKRFVFEFKQHAVAAILLHALAQPFALERVQVTQPGADHCLGGGVHQAKGGGAAGTFMRQHRHAFGLAVGLQAPAQIHAAGGRHFAMRLGDGDARHLHSAQRDRRDHDRQRRRCARGHQPRQSCQLHMFAMQARWRAVVFHAQPQFATVSVSQANDGLDQIVVGQALAVALELDGEGFALGQGWGHVYTLMESGRSGDADATGQEVIHQSIFFAYGISI